MIAFLDSLHILVVYGLIVLGILAAIELGFQVGRYWNKRTGEATDSSPGALIGATVGLLAFMLAFTTGIALNRFDNRRALVVEEANSIGTTFLRAGYLEEPINTESQALLREYVDVRLQAIVPGQFDAALTRSEEIQQELWSMAETLAKAHPDSPLLAIYIESLNSLIDVHSKRLIAAQAARLPAALWTEMFLMSTLVMFLVGVGNGLNGRRNLLAVVVMALVFGAVILLIIDLDRSQSGYLTVSQQALIQLQQDLSGVGP